MRVWLALAIGLAIAGCGGDDGPGTGGNPPTPDGAAGGAGAELDAAREAEAGMAGGAGTGVGGAAGTAGSGGNAGKAGSSGTGGATGGSGGSGGAGGVVVDASQPDAVADSASVDARADADANAADADAATVDAKSSDTAGDVRAADGIADAGNVCSPPSAPGWTNDCNSGCGPTTDAPWPVCSRLCTAAADGYSVSGGAPQDVSIIFPAVTQTELGCLSCTYPTSWSFTVSNPASAGGCIRVTTSPGRFVQPYENAATASPCAGPALPTTTCAVVSHTGSESKAIVVLAAANAPRGWVRVETGPCPLACP